MGFIEGLLTGFFAGLFANLVFLMAIRLLPATWCRYEVAFGGTMWGLSDSEESPFRTWVVHIDIDPPGWRRVGWRRILMEPVREYLYTLVTLDGQLSARGKWVDGDLTRLSVLADGATLHEALLLTVSRDKKAYFSDQYPTAQITDDGLHKLTIEVIRMRDNEMADRAEIGFMVQDGLLKEEPWFVT